jgi:hypothetical protein
MKTKKYSQVIILEFDNTGPLLYRIVSDNPITIEDVAKYFEESDDFNENRDNIFFVDEPTPIEL